MAEQDRRSATIPPMAEAVAPRLASPTVEEFDARLETMPQEVGVLLVTIGVMGLILPGLVGTPALLAGWLMLWPRGFRAVNARLHRACPRVHREGMRQLCRYLDALERRYPGYRVASRPSRSQTLEHP